MFRVTQLCVLSLALISACRPLVVRSYFEPIGKLGATRDAQLIVDTPDKVDVYLRSAPQGFTLAENEVMVEEGFGHQVLGHIRLGRGSGNCDLGSVGQKDLIREMQKRAHEVGANAVIFAHTEWKEGTTGAQRCTPGDLDPTYASAWAVVVNVAAAKLKPSN